jgi:hypothetical protein
VTQPARATSTEDAVAASAASLLTMIDAVRRRIRLQRVSQALGQAGAIALTLLGLGLAHTKLQPGAAHAGLLWLALGLPALLVCIAAARGISRLAAAQLLDHVQKLPDLMSSAWAFSRLPTTTRSPFMNAALVQAGAAARDIEPAASLAIGWPRTLAIWPLLALGVLCVWRLPTAAAPRPSSAPVLAAHELLLSRVELAAARRELEQSSANAPEASRLRALNQEFERLLELIAERRIDRLQLLRALADLQTRATQASLHSAERTFALRELGRALASQSITKDLGAALADGALRTSQLAFLRLAQRAATAPDRKELERMRAALRAGLSRQAAARERRMAEARRELDKLQRDPAQPSSQKQTADRQALDQRLDQERAQREQARELEKLERELGQAANEASADPAALARGLQSAAQTLQRMQASADQEHGLQRLNERIEELRERLAEHATQPPPTAAKQAAPAAEQPLTLQGFERSAEGERAKQTGPPADTHPQQQPSGSVLQKTPESAADAPPQSPMSETRLGPPEPAASNQGRPQHGPATPSGQANVDMTVAGNLGKGPSRSAVIYDAAARGFATQSYQKVHADYAAHAESELEREPLPAGYRFYVRRYFQLIQPRDAAGDTHE